MNVKTPRKIEGQNRSLRRSHPLDKSLKQRIEPCDIKDARQGNFSIAVIGCGWMGLPTACLFSEQGINVYGVDIQQKVVDMMENGECPYNEPGLTELLKRNVESGRLHFSTEYKTAVTSSNFIIIIVPTGIYQNRLSNYSSLRDACQEVGKSLSRNKIVIIESTIAPSQVQIFKDILEKSSGLKAGKDFSLAYSPIRASAGTILKDLVNYPKAIGGIDKRSQEFAETLFSIIVKGQIIKASDMMTAAAAKLFENVFRDVNIALANQLARYCEEFGLDFNEVRRISNTIPSHCQPPKCGCRCRRTLYSY